MTHRQVLGSVWGAGYDADVHLLRMTIRNLRLKLEAAAPGESYIATEYGLGYRLTGPSRPGGRRRLTKLMGRSCLPSSRSAVRDA